MPTDAASAKAIAGLFSKYFILYSSVVLAELVSAVSPVSTGVVASPVPLDSVSSEHPVSAAVVTAVSSGSSSESAPQPAKIKTLATMAASLMLVFNLLEYMYENLL
jgi:hypothetical protein